MELATVHFDTYKAMTLLKEKGFNKKQSEGIVEVMQQVALSGVATKQDLQAVKDELKDDIQIVKDELKNDIQSLNVKIEKMESNITSKMYIGQAMAVGAVIGAFKLFGII